MQTGKDLTSLISRNAAGRVVHLAHHVQAPFCTPASRPHHNPDRVKASETILTLMDSFIAAGISTHATALVNRSTDLVTSEEIGLHPVLIKKADKINHGYASSGSAFRDGSASICKDSYDTIILTGFNTSLCFLNTAKDALAKKFNIIVPIDGTANATLPAAHTLAPTREEALHIIQEKGAILCNAKDLVSIIKGHSRNCEP